MRFVCRTVVTYSGQNIARKRKKVGAVATAAPCALLARSDALADAAAIGAREVDLPTSSQR